MVDWVVIFTPLLVLGVLLLLGYAGCDFDPSSTAGGREFDIVLRARASLGTVTEIFYSCRPPSGPEIQTGDPSPVPDEIEGEETSEPVNVYIHSCGEPVRGQWRVACQVTMTAAGITATEAAFGDVMLDESDEANSPEAAFQTTGSPATGNFAVVFIGVP
jgi:hypothetical protein